MYVEDLSVNLKSLPMTMLKKANPFIGLAFYFNNLQYLRFIIRLE